MKLNIGETIKRLRKEREITQEEFSEVLGVSCQSVSRWENHFCYPDIELIPTIAAFFGISTDKLMGIDEVAEKTAVDQYLNAFQEAISVGNIDECIRIARAGVAEYPNNYALLNKLMYALFVAGSDDADIPDWKENMEKYDAEIVALGERIIKYCSDTEIRLEATERLAFQHCEMGRTFMGRTIYETLPSMTYCKEVSMWQALSQEERLPYVREAIDKTYSLLRVSMKHLSFLVSDEDAVKIYEKEQALIKLMYDDEPSAGSWLDFHACKGHCQAAKRYLNMKDVGQALDHLTQAVKSAYVFDNRPTETKLISLMLGEQTDRRTDFDTADSRPLRVILRDSWLAEKEFDVIRNTNEFKAMLEKLIP